MSIAVADTIFTQSAFLTPASWGAFHTLLASTETVEYAAGGALDQRFCGASPPIFNMAAKMEINRWDATLFNTE